MTEVYGERDFIFERISNHRDKIDKRYGRNGFAGLSNDKRNTILAEEIGEVARAVLEGDRANLEDELIDVAQVVVAWLETIDD